jgi:hypothetical protein
LAYRLWSKLHSTLHNKGRIDAYNLQRDAIPAVAAMQLRGLGFDPIEHARQVDASSRDLADARRDYVELTGNPPPAKPADIRRWVAEVSGDLLRRWP